jgi:hypothetical protein
MFSPFFFDQFFKKTRGGGGILDPQGQQGQQGQAVKSCPSWLYNNNNNNFFLNGKRDNRDIV